MSTWSTKSGPLLTCESTECPGRCTNLCENWEMTKWEYIVVSLPWYLSPSRMSHNMGELVPRYIEMSEATIQLNDLGEQGWELVSTVHTAVNNVTKVNAILKRPT